MAAGAVRPPLPANADRTTALDKALPLEHCGARRDGALQVQDADGCLV
jgi:hypothetical protein